MYKAGSKIGKQLEAVSFFCSRDTNCKSTINNSFYLLVAVDELTNRRVSCSCLPACFEIAYDRSISSAILSDGSFGTVDDIFAGRSKEHVRLIFIEHKD